MPSWIPSGTLLMLVMPDESHLYCNSLYHFTSSTLWLLQMILHYNMQFPFVDLDCTCYDDPQTTAKQCSGFPEDIECSKFHWSRYDMSRWNSRVNGQFILPSKQNNAGHDVSVTAVLHRYISTPVAVWLCLKIGCPKVQIMVNYVHIFSLLKPISWTSIFFSKPPANSWNHVFSAPMCRFILWKVMQ